MDLERGAVADGGPVGAIQPGRLLFRVGGCTFRMVNLLEAAMTLNAQFFTTLRGTLYSGGLGQNAVDSCNAVCVAFDSFTGHDHCVDDLAAILATVYTETGSQLNLAIEEIGKGRGHAYGSPDGQYGKIYYGRGPCQVTWLTNYQKAKIRTGIDFVQFPERMCDPQYGVVYMIDAMYGGTFTGKGLRTYITPGKVTTRANFKAARAIINGQDKADAYADYCAAFQRALLTGYDKPATVTAPVAVVPPAPVQHGLVHEIASWFKH